MFIKQNKIKTITASVVNKADGEVIRDKGLAQVFLFDTLGNFTRHYYNEITSLEKTETEVSPAYKRGRVTKKGYTKIDYKYQYDTLGTEFFYTTTGHLKMKRVCIGDFFNTTYYDYFGNNVLSKQTVCKETNAGQRGEPFKLGVQTIISEEKFEYENLTPTQIKKKFINDQGKPYKQGILNYSNEKIVDESYEFIVGFIRSAVSYKYDPQGKLIEKRTTDNSNGNNEEKFIYDYDSSRNIKTEKRFRNGVQTDEIIYLYDSILPFSLSDQSVKISEQVGATPAITKEESSFSSDSTKENISVTGQEHTKVLVLTSQADRQIQKESIVIVKYEYSFY